MLVPARPRAEYFPVFYLEPLYGNEAAFGFDLMSEATRKTALDHARREGQVSASDPITLVQGPGDGFGILVAAPVRSRPTNSQFASEAEAPILGFVLAVLRIDQLVNRSLKPWAQNNGDAGIRVFSHPENEGRKLVFSYFDEMVKYGKPVSQFVEVANKEWRILIYPQKKWLHAHEKWLPLSVLILGLGFTLMASVVYKLRLKGMAQLTALSESLEKQNQELRAVSNALSKYLPKQLWDGVLGGQAHRGIASKRKQLTVFVSDIANFTDFSSKLQSEELTLILNDYFAEMSAIGSRHGATLDKYVGDAIIMFFGDPDSKGPRQDAIACVRMALEMQDRLVILRKKWLRQGYHGLFHARMAIHTGFCDVGNFGSADRMSYTIVGLNVNIAARVQKLGLLDGVTITQTTFDLVKDHFETSDSKQVALKGVGREVCLRNVVKETPAHATEPDILLPQRARPDPVLH